MIHNTTTVTRTKALVTAPTAMAIARAISHGRRIRPRYPVPDHAADQTMCDVLDDHYGSAGGVPLRPPELFNRPDPLKFEHHCASTTAAFAVDVWQFNRAGLVNAAASVCSRVGTRQGTIDKYSENHVYFRSSTGATRLTASSWDNNETTPGTDNLNTLLFNDSGDMSVGYDIWRVPITTLAREVEIHTTSGPDIAASDWNLPPAGTDLNFDTTWPDGVVRSEYEFRRRH